MGDHYTHFTPKKRAKFFDLFSQGHTVKHCAESVGITRRTAYLAKENDADFAQKWEEAEAAGTEALEQEARRRAVEGVETPIFDKKGEQIGTTLKHSDVLLIFLMKGRSPQKYRDNVKIESETKHSGGVLVIGGDEAAYVAALKQIKNGHKEEAIKHGG